MGTRKVIGAIVVKSIVTKRRTVVVTAPDDADDEELSDVLYGKLIEDGIEWDIIDECCENLVPAADGDLVEIAQAGELARPQYIVTRKKDGELILKAGSQQS